MGIGFVGEDDAVCWGEGVRLLAADPLLLKLIGLALVELVVTFAKGDTLPKRSPPGGGLPLRRRDDPLPLLGAGWGGGRMA